eukprot:6466848-Amphidinium_carterae.1
MDCPWTRKNPLTPEQAKAFSSKLEQQKQHISSSISASTQRSDRSSAPASPIAQANSSSSTHPGYLEYQPARQHWLLMLRQHVAKPSN